MKNRRFACIALFVLALGVTWVPAMAAEKTAPKKSTETQKKEAEKSSASQPASSGGMVELNTATKEQLMTLPGITEAYANKIIEGRPYREKITLRRQNILPADVFYDITDRIVIDPNKLQRALKKAKEPAKKK